MTEITEFKLGRLPNDPDQPRLRLSPFLKEVAAPPSWINWDAPVKYWPMYDNDKYGNCVWAMIGHAIQVFTANARSEVQITVEDVNKGYSDVTGFDPKKPSTDKGTVMQDALNYWRKEGVGGHKIKAFAEVDYRSQTEMQQAAAAFGVVLLGFYFPRSAWQQFERQRAWDVVDPDGGNAGGHAVLGARYDVAMGQWYWITWGKEHPVTFDFIAEYAEEAWVVASDEWVSAVGTAPSGLDVDGLNEAFTDLTGEPGPFEPPETDDPEVPSALDEAVKALLTDPWVATWAKARHNGRTRYVSRKLQALLEAGKSV